MSEGSYQHVPQDPDESYDRPSDYPGDEESMMSGSSNGFNYREYRRPADTFKGKVEHKFWKGKQTMLEKFGKQQDEYVVAGDAEVDARLEAFRQIQKTCIDLLRAVEVYQKKIFALSQEENESGRFLREKGSVDKTKAGKMMISVGKALSYTAQQRLTLRVPLVRLYQEVETFRHRAVGDTWQTVNRMEALRSEYRAALLWMANISKELDPEAYRKLDKYREVQSEVKVTKTKFDKCKVDVIQKVDLLSASRCNLLSATLVAYQQSLLKFWENTSNSLTKVYEQFRGHPTYQFQMLKHIIPDDSYTRENEVDDEDDKGEAGIKEERIAKAVHIDEKDDDSEKVEEEGSEVRETENDDDDDTLISLDNLPDRMPRASESGQSNEDSQITDLLGGSPAKKDDTSSATLEPSSSAVLQGIDDLLGLSGDNSAGDGELNMSDFMLNNSSPALATLSTSSNNEMNNGMPGTQTAGQDLLSTDSNQPTTDDLLFGNLSQPTSSEYPGDGSSFTETWNKMFGGERQEQPGLSNDNPDSPTKYMPSDLIDSFASLDPYAPSGGGPPVQQSLGGQASTDLLGSSAPAGQPLASARQAAASKPSEGNLSTWLNLFSDLDPLSNPDAIGKENKENDAKRSC